MNTLGRGKSDIMIHTGCGFVSGSIRTFSFVSGKIRTFFAGAVILALAYIFIILA